MMRHQATALTQGMRDHSSDPAESTACSHMVTTQLAAVNLQPKAAHLVVPFHRHQRWTIWLCAFHPF